MKKLAALFLAAGLVFATVNPTSAVEVNVSGTLDFVFGYSQNLAGNNSFFDDRDLEHNFSGERLRPKHFEAAQRLRLKLGFIMAERLSAYYQAQVGTFDWGGSPLVPGRDAEKLGGALGTRAGNMVTRLAWLDWMIPNTGIRVRMGQQDVALPSFTFGSPVLDDTATGIMVSSAVHGNIGLTGFWLRVSSGPRRGAVASVDPGDDTFDLVGAVADFHHDGFAVSPWVMAGPLGKNADTLGNALPMTEFQVFSGNGPLYPLRPGARASSDSLVLFAGLGAALTLFDPFRFTADFYYSATDNKHKSTERAGWYAALGAEYKTARGTPALKGWYASGDDKKATNGSERPLSLSGSFNPTTTYFDGRSSIANTIDNTAPGGTWGLSAQWNGLSFVKNLDHNISVTYFRGTNNWHAAEAWMRHPTADSIVGMLGPATYMTSKDTAVEVDFTTTYTIDDNLATVLELSSILEDFDKSVWGRLYALGGDRQNPDAFRARFSNIWRASLNFQYAF